MNNDKEIQRHLEENIKKENFEKVNLSSDDIIKILTDEKGYIREKLGVNESKARIVKPIEINKESIRKIAKEVINEYRDNQGGVENEI